VITIVFEYLTPPEIVKESPMVHKKAKQKPVETDKSFRILEWIADNVIATVPILAAVSYAVFRVAFLIYHSRFGVTPEKVGLDYAGILTVQAAGGLLEFLVGLGGAL
jgi:hypothetical protein